jgi:exodeoxyribonuclease V beta subunit
MQKAMEQNDYYLQASLYSVAVKKYLASIDPRPFDEIFGGAFYVFLRGLKKFSNDGVFFFSPDTSLNG